MASARELLRAEQPPTAIFATSDVQAAGVLMAARDMGVRCPRDLSVVGYDNIPFAEFLSLTTMWQHHDQLARNAATLLLEELRTGVRAGERVVLQPELVVRTSTAARSAGAASRPPRGGRRCTGIEAPVSGDARRGIPADRRASGILLHPTSLPGPVRDRRPGDLRLRSSSTSWRAGQSLWQVLPLGPDGVRRFTLRVLLFLCRQPAAGQPGRPWRRLGLLAKEPENAPRLPRFSATASTTGR